MSISVSPMRGRLRREPSLYALFSAAFAALVTLIRPKYRSAQSGSRCQ
jgi:hypothetical protein